MTRALDIRNLNVVRGGRRVVGGVNLTLEEGASLGIVGESGCGKSTLLRAVAGIIRDWDGEIAAFGRGLGRNRSTLDRRLLQIVFQDPAAASIRRIPLTTFCANL